MTSWVLALILSLVPSAPYADTFEATAAAIDRASHEAPLYSGEDGPERSAAALVAVAFFESHFDPKAVGDHGASRGLFQVGVSNLATLGLTRDDLFDPYLSARAALTMIRSSFHSCRVRPKGDALNEYASGSCARGGRESRHRLALAAELISAHPARWIEHEGAWGF